jgi:CheY-like chemotaxis protein
MATVMVVDDEDVLLEMVAALIEDLGHTPLAATNGQEALRLLAAQDTLPSLIISDIMMPRMNGIEMVQRIKAHPQWQTIPVVLMSAAGKPVADHQADIFIHKPFDLDTITDLVERYTAQADARTV